MVVCSPNSHNRKGLERAGPDLAKSFFLVSHFYARAQGRRASAGFSGALSGSGLQVEQCPYEMPLSHAETKVATPLPAPPRVRY